jgi:hypothetical protein
VFPGGRLTALIPSTFKKGGEFQMDIICGANP